MSPGRLLYGFDAAPVLDPKDPIEGESLLSWIARTAIDNELPHITAILRDVGQRNRNRIFEVACGDVDVDGLGTILGSTAERVASLRAAGVAPGRGGWKGAVRFLGRLVPQTDLHFQTRRFAPEALAGDGIPHHRSAWLIRTLPVCGETFQVLRSRCDCGAPQTWVKVPSLVLCRKCDRDLRTLPAERLPEEHRAGMSTLVDLLAGTHDRCRRAMDALPPALSSLDPGEVFEVALTMARIVDPSLVNPRLRAWRDRPMALARALSIAAGLLPAWPDTLWLALEAAGDIRVMEPRCRELVNVVQILQGKPRHRLPSPILADLKREIAAITVPANAEGGMLVEIQEAGRIVGMNPKTIRNARRRGDIRGALVMRGGELLPAYHREDMLALAGTMEWPACASIGKRLSIPPYAVEQLCSEAVLPWAQSPHRTLRTGLYVDPGAVEALERDLLLRAGPPLDDDVPLNVVMRGVGGRLKPWAPLISGLLDGGIRYSLADHSRGMIGVRRVRLRSGDVRRIRALATPSESASLLRAPTTLTLVDACDVLNVSNRAREILLPHRSGFRCHTWLFEVPTLLRLAREVVSVPELMAVLDMPCATTMAAVRRARLEPRLFGFRRDPIAIAGLLDDRADAMRRRRRPDRRSPRAADGAAADRRPTR